MDIDCKSALEIVTLMNTEDSQVAEAVRQELPAIAQTVDTIVARLRKGGQLFYVGAGTSGRLGALDAAECPPTFGVPREMVQALIAGGHRALTESVEGAEDDRAQGYADARQAGVGEKDAVVGIAASGRTPYVLGAIQWARERGAATIGLMCNRPAPLAEAVDIAISPLVGPEVIAGSTRLKAGTAQKMVLNMLSTATMIRLGKVYSNLMVDVQPTNAKLVARALRILQEAAAVSPNRAEELLAAADNEVKTALLVALTGMTVEQARHRLAQAQGHVRLALARGDPAT